MDASMQQKVALTAAHLLSQGRVADMGMGSGTGSYSLAALYPGLHVTGVDVSAEMVAIAADTHHLPNLDFRVGDIAQPVFEPGTLDGILDSSVLHHVTTFSGYDREAAGRTLAVQVHALRDYGVLVVRDFLDPGDGHVTLDLPTHDGDASDDPRSCSSAALLRRFAREYRSLHDRPGFALVERPGAAEGWQRFELELRHAVEFVLRKDYRRDWEAEVKEEYTYYTQEEFEARYAKLGLRVLASTPIRNPWIVRNRFRGKFVLRELEGREIEDPATNYVIVGERVPDGLGVDFVEHTRIDPLDFLGLHHYRHRGTGKVMDLVARPHLTVDAIPWFRHDDDVYVLARMSYPRPILRARRDGDGVASIDGSRAPAYVTEPLTVIQDDKPVAQTIEEALLERAGLGGDKLVGFRPGSTYFPSPGGLREEVRSMFVEIQPVFVQRDIPQRSGFSTSGRVCAIEARQLLRAAAVGGLPDARLELNVYDLLRRQGLGPGPFIGEALALPDRGAPGPVVSTEALTARPARRRFERAGPDGSRRFLKLRCSTFVELGRRGDVLHERAFEYVVPRPVSINTVSVALLRRAGDDVLIAIDDADLPVAQCISGNSELLVAPAWRLPHWIESLTPAKQWILERLREEYGVEVGDGWWLGGRYHPSPGTTPEVVHPLAVDVASVARDARSLLWVSLRELVATPSLLRDGHLRIAAERSAHALLAR
jgi:SAM-dependent methyltransferase